MDRRATAIPLLIALALLPAGCGENTIFGDPQRRAMNKSPDVDRKPFEIGPASDWREEGMYWDYAQEHGVVLVSAHDMLVALLLVNPDTGRTVHFDRSANLFRDPQDDSVYTTDGLLWGESESEFSLERCRIRHMGPLDDPDVELIVDPGVRFAFERQEWSKAASNHLYTLAEDDE